jgi:hypothetical protein
MAEITLRTLSTSYKIIIFLETIRIFSFLRRQESVFSSGLSDEVAKPQGRRQVFRFFCPLFP